LVLLLFLPPTMRYKRRTEFVHPVFSFKWRTTNSRKKSLSLRQEEPYPGFALPLEPKADKLVLI